jgi:two-component system, OmpR family, response regulator TctD
MKILLVEDNKDVGEILRLCLEPHRVHQSYSIQDAKNELSHEVYDLIIIDIGLPDGSGLAFCADLELEKQSTPKVILSASQDLTHKVYALTTGAVDYISKPFHIPEFKARVEVQLKQSQSKGQVKHQFGIFEFDQDFQNCFFYDTDGKKNLINLTPTEMKIFLLLLRHQGEVVAKEDLIQQIWGATGVCIAPRGLDTHIANLRKKLSPINVQIHCAWGRGYSCEIAPLKKAA